MWGAYKISFGFIQAGELALGEPRLAAGGECGIIGIELFNQNQFVIAGVAQTISLAGVDNPALTAATQ